ncbi:DUF4126 domain-containing protein [Rhodoferax sp.]|uniref:DUF4126 domain-containing protein n=1 Tax=Rhodoferax sp. TaxID=50421 RepID=UPI00374C9189
MTIYVLALLIGVVAGLRAMTAPAAISWAAHLGWLPLAGTPLAFMGYAYTPYIFTLLAAIELVTDQLPNTPSRKVPTQFGARLASGALCGAALGATAGGLGAGLIAGVVGAMLGTVVGASLRARLAKTLGRDLPAALLEDALAVVGAIAIVSVHL